MHLRRLIGGRRVAREADPVILEHNLVPLPNDAACRKTAALIFASLHNYMKNHKAAGDFYAHPARRLLMIAVRSSCRGSACEGHFGRQHGTRAGLEHSRRKTTHHRCALWCAVSRQRSFGRVVRRVGL